MCFDGHVQIVFACVSPWMNHTGCRLCSCRDLEILQCACTHSSFILHLGICGILWLASMHDTPETALFLCCVIFHSCIVLLTNIQPKPLNFPTICSTALLFFAAYTSTYSARFSLPNNISAEFNLLLLPSYTVKWGSINIIYDCKYFFWHQRAELCYPLSSHIHLCSRHAQTLFVLLFIGMYSTVWQCCVYEHSRLCSSRQFNTWVQSAGRKVCIIKPAVISLSTILMKWLRKYQPPRSHFLYSYQIPMSFIQFLFFYPYAVDEASCCYALSDVLLNSSSYLLVSQWK